MALDICRFQANFGQGNPSLYPVSYARYGGARLVAHEDGSLEIASKSLAWVLGEKIAPLAHKCIDGLSALYRSIDQGIHAFFPSFPLAEAKSIALEQPPFHKRKAEGDSALNNGPFSYAHPMDPLSPGSGTIQFGIPPHQGIIWESRGAAVLDINGDSYGDIALTAQNVIYVIYGFKERGQEPRFFDLNTLNGNNGIYIWDNNTQILFCSSESFGSCPMTSGDINGDGFADLVISSMVTSSSKPTEAGHVIVVYGGPNLKKDIFLDQLDTNSGLIITGRYGANGFGSSVATGKLNHDCYDDILIGERTLTDGKNTSYAGYIVFGSKNLSHFTISSLVPGGGCEIKDVSPLDMSLGSSVRAGHVTGEILDDVIVGAPAAPYVLAPPRPGTGQVYLVYGKTAFPFDIELGKLKSQTGSIFSPKDVPTIGRLGQYSAVGDVNGDGLEDIMVTANNGQSIYDVAHAIYVVYGRRDFPFSFGTEIADGQQGMMLTTESLPVNFLYWRQLVIGDWNGDGIGDMAEGMYCEGSKPLVFLAYGSRHLPQSLPLSSIDGYNGVVIQADGSLSLALGDVDGDGFKDLIAGNYLIYGRERLLSPEPSPAGLAPWKLALITGICAGVLGVGGMAVQYMIMRKRRGYLAVN